MRTQLTVLGLTVVCAFNAAWVLSQAGTANSVTFDAASIKVNKSGATEMSISGRGNRFIARNVTLRQLMQFAYRGQDDRSSEVLVVGGPSWIDTMQFDIEAITNETPGRVRSAMSERVQTLLRDRFLLKVRVAKKDAVSYELVVAKGGSRLRLSADQTPIQTQTDPDTIAPVFVPSAGRGRTIPDGPVPRGSLYMRDNELTGSAVTVARLASFLSRQMGTPVTDRTNLSGLFDVKIRFQGDLQPRRIPQEAIRRAGVTGIVPAARLSATVVAAAVQVLGIQFEPVKGTIDVFVIDGVQHPSEN